MSQESQQKIAAVFVRRGQQVLGPIPSTRLRELVRLGKLTASDEIRRDGTEQWVHARQIRGLFDAPQALTNTNAVAPRVLPTPPSDPQRPQSEASEVPAVQPPGNSDLQDRLKNALSSDGRLTWKERLTGRRNSPTPVVVYSVPAPTAVESRNFYRPYGVDSKSPSGGLLAINGSTRDSIIEKFRQNFQLSGSHVRNGGAVSPSSMLGLIGSASGALGASSIASGTLFVATANPSTLMALGNGVGSAVMGASGIIGQAPFLPAAAGLMPVVAPLMAFQALASVIQLRQFAKVQEQLSRVERNVNRLLQRSEATLVGEVIAASCRIDELEEQLGLAKCFTPDMSNRLALVSDRVAPLFERYHLLLRSQLIDASVSREDLKLHQNDAYFSVVLSIMDLRIDVLRLQLAVQENPALMESASKRLAEKVTAYKKLWIDVAQIQNVAKDIADDLKSSADEMTWMQRNVSNRGKHKELSKQSETLAEHVQALRAAGLDHVTLAREYVETINRPPSTSAEASIVYWRDEVGDHAYFTDDLDFEVPNSSVKGRR